MKSLFSIIFLSLALIVAGGSSNLHERALGPRQSLHSRLASQLPAKRQNKCRPKHSGNTNQTPAPSSKPVKTVVPPKDNDDDDEDGGGQTGLIRAGSSRCGSPGATVKTTKTGGPNGRMDWMNCGIDGGGWNPPDVQIDDVYAVDLAQALKDPKSPFKACTKFLHIFEEAAERYGVPAIFFASFAMQESSCNPNTVGQGGEQGIMQITKDKCGGAPGGNCRDPRFNILAGAKYFRNTLNAVDGNVFQAVGTYNGWSDGLTIGKATRARHSNCCRCQNNLDYLQQFFNGFICNTNAYDSKFRLGKYFNLDPCGE